LVGEKVKKIFVKKSSDVFFVRDLFTKHFEADIMFNQRYIIDKYGEAKVYPLKVMSLDIETDSDTTFPNMKDPDQAIISCAFKDNKGNKQVLFYKSKECKVEITPKSYLKVFNTEEELLNAIIVYIKNEDPDILTGWYSNDFDLLYMIRRMKKLKIKYSKLSPLYSVWITDKWEDVVIKGRVLLDMKELYEKFRGISNQGRAESYSLEFTSQEVLGVGKIPHKENFHEMWINKPNELIEYNLRDAELVIQINTKLDIVNFFNYLRAKSFAQLSQVYATSSLVDGFLLKKAHNKIVLPSKPIRKKQSKYKGAHVFTPKPGLYNNVLALDVAGLYPNIIKTFNVGYETFNPKGEILLKEGIGFNKGIGLISEVMRELQKERQIYKDLMKKATIKSEQLLNHYKQYSVKVLANSFYGYLGFPGGRIYKKEVAEAITIWGQELLFWTEKFLKKQGYTILAGDTDSVYVESKSKGMLKLLKEGKEIVDKINESYSDFAKHYGSNECTLELEFEKIFKTIIFVGKKGEERGAKKKYAYRLLWEDGKQVNDKIKFTGFSSVRSDTQRLAKETERKVVKMIMDGETKETIITLIKDLDKKIRTHLIPIEEIGVPTGISKHLREYGKTKNENGKKRKTGTPPVVVGARYCYDKKTEVLTEDGWQLIKDVGNKKIATLRDNSHLEYQRPNEIIVDNYKGEMYYINSNHINMLVTPNHNIYCSNTHLDSKKKRVWKLQKAKDALNKKTYFKKYCNWIGQECQFFILPYIEKKWTCGNHHSHHCKKWKTKKILMDDWLEFLGYIISEGSIRGSKGSKYENEIRISQYKSVNMFKYNKIKKCLDKLPFYYSYNDFGFRIKNRQLWHYLKQLGNSSQKHIPREFLKLSSRHLQILFNSMFLGDGHTTNSGTQVYTTISEQLINDTQELFLKIGYQGNILKSEHNNKPLYHICKIKPRDVIINYRKAWKHDKMVPYNGLIYCVNVKNHIIYVRRNGKAYWCGNSNKYLNTRFGQGSKPKWVYIKKVADGYPDTPVLSFDEDIPKGFLPDYDKIIEKMFKAKLEELFKAVGFGDFPNIDYNIKELDKFFG